MERVVVDRRTVLGFRFRRHQLQRGADTASAITDVDLLDVGVADTGPDGALWALAVRGAPVGGHGAGDGSAGLDPDLAFAWTVRSSPHAYRRRDLDGVVVATAPWSEADASKRVFDAAKPLRQAGIGVLDALAHVAHLERDLVTGPMAKGELSGRLTDLLDPPHLRFCRPCDTTHIYELPFRLSALQAGLELEPGTAPPVLHRVEGLEPSFYGAVGEDVDPRFDLVRGYLRFWGPGRPKDVAAFLDTTVKEVDAHWPDDVVEVEIDGVDDDSRIPRTIMADDVDALVAGGDGLDGTVRLVGPYDPYLQLRGREVLVADPVDQKAVWPVLGRPGGVLVDGELVGTWRPTTTRGHFGVRYDPWVPDTPDLREAVEVEAERLAAHRDLPFAGLLAP